MKISTRGRYALRVMLDLASQDAEQLVPLKDVAARQGITLKYMEQIITLLKKAGYLESSRGSRGGYRLAKPPEEYTVGDILRTTEGSLAPISCLENEENPCMRKNICPTLTFWEGLDEIIRNYVDGVTLRDLMGESVLNVASTDCPELGSEEL